MNSSESPGPRIEQWSSDRLERSVPIEEGGLVIGRAAGVAIRFDDTRVSRWHARVERNDDGSCFLVDTSTHRATFVNGRRAPGPKPVQLSDGDRIEVAGRLLVFRGIRTIVPDEEGAGEGSTVLQTITDLSPASLSRRARHPADAFRAVLDLNSALRGGGGLDELLGRALESLIGFFPAATSGLVITADPDGRLPIRAFRSRGGAPAQPVLSRSILDQVLKRCEGVLIGDIAEDPRFREQDSIRSHFRTALAVPLAGHDDRPLGMVQLVGRSDCDRVFTGDDLELLAALARPIAAAVETSRLLRDRAEWAAARRIQRAILPRERPVVHGYAFWECYRPVYEIGGDLYDYIRVDRDGRASDPRWVVGVGDVMGKGSAAALMSSAISPEVRHSVWGGAPPADVLSRVNRSICEGEFDGRLVTMILVELDPRTHTLTIANAGHERPLLRRADGTVQRLELPDSGVPLGVDPGAVYTPIEVPIRAGEVLVLHSDGLGDAEDVNGHRFGLDAVARTLSRAPFGVLPAGDALLEAVTEHAKGRVPFDDLTIVCLGRECI
jgi:sigma-B regulation protein RsbU (phosphoserine phosphatase)